MKTKKIQYVYNILYASIEPMQIYDMLKMHEVQNLTIIIENPSDWDFEIMNHWNKKNIPCNNGIFHGAMDMGKEWPFWYSIHFTRNTHLCYQNQVATKIPY